MTTIKVNDPRSGADVDAEVVEDNGTRKLVEYGGNQWFVDGDVSERSADAEAQAEAPAPAPEAQAPEAEPEAEAEAESDDA